MTVTVTNNGLRTAARKSRAGLQVVPRKNSMKWNDMLNKCIDVDNKIDKNAATES